MKKIYSSLIVFCLGCIAQSAFAQTQFNYTGGVQYYTVPTGVTSVQVDIAGAQGGTSANGQAGGLGGRIQCNVAVTAGQVLNVYVGGKGISGNYTNPGNAGGYNGGGSGTYGGGSGGGGSDIRIGGTGMTNRVAVAGGGGGGGANCGEVGANAGGTNGANGINCGSYNSYSCGAGGTQTAGGLGATNGASSGGLGFAGSSASGGYWYYGYWGTYYYYYYYYGGGGGGGYYGGGGGEYGSGGGGSSYPTTGATTSFCSAVTNTGAFRSGNGYVTITPPTVNTTPSSLAFGNVTTNTTSVPPMYFAMNGLVLSSSGTLTITPPSGFSVSLNGTTWFTTGMSYTYSGTGFPNTNVYVRFSPTASSSYSGNITITGGGLPSTVNVAVTGTGASACSGAPTAGSAVSSTAIAATDNLISLSLSGASTAAGLYYQWQSSPNNSTWTNIEGAITRGYNFVGISANTYFRCIVTCPNGSSNNSGSVLVSYASSTIATSSCTPTFSNGCTTGTPMYTSIGLLTGDGGTTLSDPATDCGGASYLNRTSLPTAVVTAGSSYFPTLNLSASYYSNFATQVWIDFNNDGIFQTTETVGGLNYGSISSPTQICTLSIPSGAAPGIRRMRIMSNYYPPCCYGASYYPNLNPCPTTSVSYGQVRDYKISIGVPAAVPACSGTPNPGITSSTPTSNCTTFNPRVFGTGYSNGTTGLSYQWQSSTTGPSSGFSNISGATGQGYVATISSLGAVYYRLNVTCASSTSTSSVTSDTMVLPPAITGPTNVCAGANITLSHPTSGGIWTSSNTSQATVGSTTGVVTGIGSGTTPTITYTTPAGCVATTPITVNLQPAAIGGTLVVCPAATTTLTNATSGGTWSSSNTALATVGASSGVVTGVSGGNPVISYTAPTGCYSTAVVTVQALAPITGTPSMCNGFSTTLSNATSGGTWSSSNTSVATVSSTGVVSGLSVGSATISYTVASLGCSATVTAFVTNSPTAFSVTGGGSYCAGGAGVVVGVGSSNIGISYQLYAGATPVGSPITGAGFAFNFPPAFAAGPYGVVANPGTPCALTGSNTVNISIDPLPTAFTVSGGGSYCAGGTGVHVYLNSSTIGVNYQLFVNTGTGPTPVGGSVGGTSASIDFGAFTTAGTYTVTALNATTSCFNNMSGSVTISINPLPNTAYTLTGGGGYCTGGSGIGVGLSNSTVGVSYQLMVGGAPSGSPVAGTGSGISFGSQMTPGTYSVVATNTATGCVATISSTTTVVINTLPTIFTMTGGGAYCSGGTGLAVGLGGSQTGVNYQLYRGTTAVGTTMAGTGAALTYPLQTTAGSYTIIATNPTTTCVSNMFSSSSISINPLPTSFSITAPSGNSYCTGGTGVPLGLSSSDAGVTYQLLNGATVVGAASGTGSALNFGLITGAGNYTVSGTITATGCVGPMSGSQTVTIIPLPISTYSVTVTSGGNYCAGSTAPTVGLSGSQSGFSYQLLRGGVVTGSPVTGTGGAINFGAQPVAGAYTVVATTSTTPACTNNMTGSAVITINPLPTVYTLTGGGGYCAGSLGTHIGLSASDVGINYRLYNGTTAVGAPVPGIGAALDFGFITPVGTYTVSATNPVTGCAAGMFGSTVVSVNTLPTAYAVTSTATSYCAGGTGVNIGLANSATGISYQLFRGAFAVGSPMAGTGAALDFGAQTAGTYTVVATNTANGCTNNMTGSIVLNTNPLPAIFTVTGGGSYCAGGTGMHVNLNGSSVGINYQLYLGVATVGAPVAGTGGILDLGLQTAAGTYTIVAINPTTLCTNNMAGSAAIAVNALPTTYTVTGGGNYCMGGAGVSVGLTSSTTGINYQLYNGMTATGAPMAGTGSGISFGLQTGAGSYTVVATNTTSMCTQNMAGSASVVVNSLPTTFTVTGGGNYCPGTAGSNVGLSGSVSGTTYQLYRGATMVGAPLPGTGAALDFGAQTATGVYTVVANNTATTCTGSMTGSVTIGLNALPTIYNVAGGGNYCPAGSGVHVGVSGSALGASYQLYRGGVATGLPIAGTGFALDFGLHTTTGTYTIKATNNTTGCINTMNGNAIVGISSLPVAQTVTGGGNYCAGGIGVHIGLATTTTGIYYQLYNGMTATGSPMAGTGTSIDFGFQATAGTYTVMGTSVSTTCTNTMAGSVAIAIDPLPTTYNVTGGGNYCSGGAGVNVMLSGSDMGTDYQLYNGATMIGSPMAGTGSALDFGPQTAGGAYMVVATNTTTMCNTNMTGSVTVMINPLPTAYNVTGGGNYCVGGTGVHITTSGSDVGTQYQLMSGATPIGAPIAGTGFGLDFGLHTAAGTYTVSGTNTATSCTGNMSGSATVAINPLPVAYTVTGTGSTYCAGGAGIGISLSASDPGVNYQLYNGMLPVGSLVSGTGLPIDFGYHTATGTYTVKGIDATAGCMNAMTGAASVAISPAPVAFNVTGGGNYCNGGTGVAVGLSGSNVGVSYQLYNGVTAAGSPVTGTGSALNFGMQTVTGNYTVIATNAATTCNNTMTGSATVALNPLPSSFTITGGGNYCAGGAGVSVGLSGSVLGTHYQLWKGGTMVGSAVAGTGFPLDFGMQTATGNYTVSAAIASTGCTGTMTGSVSVGVNPLPTSYAVGGGGSYCPGGVGVHVSISGSNTGVMYQLYRNGIVAGAAVSGSGSGIDFGLHTSAGTYTVIGTNATTTCANNMSGSATVAVNTLPAVYAVVGGGSYCAGSTGVNVGLNGSTVGISYQLYDGTAATSTPVIGTGGPINMGPQTTPGIYTIIATDGTTLCSRNMTGSATVAVNPVVSPAVTISSGVGDNTVCSGSLTTFSAMAVNGGTSPAYQWTVNGIVTGTGTSYSYIPMNGDVVGVTLTSNATCAMPSTASNSISMTVNTSEMPTVAVSVNPGSTVCQGTLVNFTAAATHGGTAPVYSWIRNGVNVGSSATYSTTPADGDVVYCILTSNYNCRLANTATSTHTTMQVDLPSVPVVSVSAVPGTNVAPGQAVTFNAAVTNGTGTPSYQWMINGIAVPGANTPTFTTSNLTDGDEVSCSVTSGGGCAGLVGSGAVVVHVSGVGVGQVTGTVSDIKLIPNPSKGTFTVKGTLGITTDEEVMIEVTNMLGQVIYSGKAMARNGVINETIQLSSTIANGMYLLNLRSGAENKVFHLVIEQ